MTSLINTKNIYVFLITVIVVLATSFLAEHYLISETLYYNTFAEQLTAEKIEGLIEQSHK